MSLTVQIIFQKKDENNVENKKYRDTLQLSIRPDSKCEVHLHSPIIFKHLFVKEQFLSTLCNYYHLGRIKSRCGVQSGGGRRASKEAV